MLRDLRMIGQASQNVNGAALRPFEALWLLKQWACIGFSDAATNLVLV